MQDSQGIVCDLEPDSPRLVMTFGGFRRGVLAFGGQIGDIGSAPSYEFARSLSSVPLKRVYVRDHAESWYHRGVAGAGPDIDSVADRLREITAGAEEVVTLGGSAGGYGALLFGALIGAEVHAFMPQTFIDPELRAAHGDMRWAEQLEALGDDLDRRYADLLPVLEGSEGRFHVYYAANATFDAIHADRLRHLPTVTLHPFDYDRHNLTIALRESGWLEAFVNGLVTGSSVPVPARRIPAPVERAVNTARKSSRGMTCDLEPGCAEVIVTFGGLGGGSGPFPPELAQFMRLVDGRMVHVRDHARAWYHRGVTGVGPGIESVAERLRAIAPGTDRILMLGGSAGGYAALLFGALIDAEVHAFAPQTFIDPELRAAHGDKRWAEQLEALGDDLDRRYADLLPVLEGSEGRFHVYYAANATLDVLHAERLRELPNVTLHAFHYEGSDLVPALRACGWLGSFVGGLAGGSSVPVPSTPIPPPRKKKRGVT